MVKAKSGLARGECNVVICAKSEEGSEVSGKVQFGAGESHDVVGVIGQARAHVRSALQSLYCHIIVGRGSRVVCVAWRSPFLAGVGLLA